MRSVLGGDYIDWLNKTFKVGVKDYCVYWFRRAHDQLSEGGRAGLVGTNSVAEGGNRAAGLDYIVKNGGTITTAISSQEWSGEAAVHVSLVNWIKRPEQEQRRFVLDGVEVKGIATSLRPMDSDFRSVALSENEGLQFFGVVQSGDGFILSPEEAAELLSRPEADYRAVVKPFLVGDDIASDPAQEPTRWIIDFAELPLERAEEWPAALAIVRARVKPKRDRHRKRREREEWWKFSRTVRDLFRSIGPLRRFAACPATAKRFFMVWCAPHWVPSNATSVFAFEDDFAMGVLSLDPPFRVGEGR